MLELTTDKQTDRQRNKQTNKQTDRTKNNMPRYFDRKGGGEQRKKQNKWRFLITDITMGYLYSINTSSKSKVTSDLQPY